MTSLDDIINTLGAEDKAKFDKAHGLLHHDKRTEFLYTKFPGTDKGAWQIMNEHYVGISQKMNHESFFSQLGADKDKAEFNLLERFLMKAFENMGTKGKSAVQRFKYLMEHDPDMATTEAKKRYLINMSAQLLGEDSVRGLLQAIAGIEKGNTDSYYQSLIQMAQMTSRGMVEGHIDSEVEKLTFDNKHGFNAYTSNKIKTDFGKTPKEEHKVIKDEDWGKRTYKEVTRGKAQNEGEGFYERLGLK